MFVFKLFSELRRIYNFISIIFKEVFFNKKNEASKKCLFYCFFSSFFSAFSIIIINSLISGFHSDFIKSIKVLDGDLNLFFYKNISEEDFSFIKEKINNSKYKNNLESIYSFGFSELVFCRNKKIISFNFLLLNKDFFSFLINNFSKNKIQNNINFDGKKNLFASDDLREKYFFLENEKNDYIFSGKFLKDKKIIKCESLELKISKFIEFKSDFLKRTFFFSGKNYKNFYKKNPYNKIIINLKNNNSLKEIKQFLIESFLKKERNFNFEITTFEEDFIESLKILETQKFSGKIISIILFLFLAVVSFTNLSIFFEEKRIGFLSLFLNGFSTLYLNVLKYFFIFFSTVLSSIFGILFSLISIIIIDKFSLIKIDYYGELIKIPFLVSEKIILFCLFFNFFLSLLIIFREKKLFKNEFKNILG